MVEYLEQGGVIEPDNWRERDDISRMMRHVETGHTIHEDTYDRAVEERELLEEHFGDAVEEVDEWIGGMK